MLIFQMTVLQRKSTTFLLYRPALPAWFEATNHCVKRYSSNSNVAPYQNLNLHKTE